MVNILAYIMALLIYVVNWGKVCYCISAILAVFAIGSFTETNDWWLIQFFALAAFAAFFAAIGMCESERYYKRMKRQARLERQRKLKRERMLSKVYATLAYYRNHPMEEDTQSQI